MYNSYLKIPLRKFYREKRYSLINISGLSLATACCLILALYLRSEFTYDQHNTNHSNIYRANYIVTTSGTTDSFAVTSYTFGPMVTPEFDDIVDYVRLRKTDSRLVRHKDKAFSWSSIYIADDNIFDVFTHDVIYGDPKTALKNNATAAVSETFSKRYFGNENPIGKTIAFDDGVPLTINLVFADLPQNSHVKYDLLMTYNRPFHAIPENITTKRQHLFGISDYTYLVFKDGFDPNNFKNMSDGFVERHMAERNRATGSESSFEIQALKGVHFYSALKWDLPTGNIMYLYVFSFVAVFILIIACINYINLTTARSARRAKEVGMRKILGAKKDELVLRFLAEAMFFAFISVLIGVVIVEVSLVFTPINDLLDTSLNLSLMDDSQLRIGLFFLWLAVSLLSGVYPALYLSSSAPLSALVGVKGSKGNVHLRQGLVLTQFIISIAVISCTVLMLNQMNYLSDKALGFDKEQRVVVKMSGGTVLQKIPILKSELLKNTHILGATTSERIPGDNFRSNDWSLENQQGEVIPFSVEHMPVDEEYTSIMNMKIISGRDFSNRLLTDVGERYIVNEALVKKMGWSQPIGKRIKMGWSLPIGIPINSGRVVGVMEDFHYRSLHSNIGPFVLYLYNDDWENNPPETRPFEHRYMTINIASENIRDTLSFLEEKFTTFDPRHPFEFFFLDKSIDDLYRSENNLMKLIGVFSGICIFIACLGLFGLTAYTTEQRSKEISVRKVLGASASQIIFLLSKSALVLVAWGAIIASIVSYLVIDDWLNSFAYRIDINVSAFAIATLSSLVVVYVTVALQSLKTAQSDPVDALRHE